MNALWDALQTFFRGALEDLIKYMFGGAFTIYNDTINLITDNVGASPETWNSTIFNAIRNLSETVLLPIGGAIFAIVITLDLIHLIAGKNNLSDVDTWMFFKWAFKAAAGVLILSNTWPIVMGIFEAGQSIVAASGGLISNTTLVDTAPFVDQLASILADLSWGEMQWLVLEFALVGLSAIAGFVCVLIVVWGRMIEILMMISVAPIPLATMMDKEYGGLFGGMGRRYLRTLLALAFQGFLIMVCVAVYSALLANLVLDVANFQMAFWTLMGYTILMCSCLFKTGRISKAIFAAA